MDASNDLMEFHACANQFIRSGGARIGRSVSIAMEKTLNMEVIAMSMSIQQVVNIKGRDRSQSAYAKVR